MAEISNDDKICGTGFTEKDLQEGLKTHLQRQGVKVTNTRTEQYGNTDCVCGSGKRYDMCCSPRKMTSLF